MSKYYPPIFGSSKFHCALCNVYAKQEWKALEFEGTFNRSPFKYSICDHCGKICYWYMERMIVPGEAPVPPHHEDLPASCQSEYNEARDIAGRSPKAAAALMRLVVQKLMVDLGQVGKNINDDYCRVIGNNAVHPGEINIDDDPSVAYSLFEMVNFVVEDRITKPKKIAELYNKLPAGVLKAVEKRDA